MRGAIGLGAFLIVLLVSGTPAGANGPTGSIPYRWVDPPAFVRGELNRPPLPGTGEVTLGPRGSGGASVTTGDGQATLVIPDGAFEPAGDPTTLKIDLVPLDPGALAPPPRGLGFEGNAYRISVSGGADQGIPELRQPATIILTYARGGGTILALEASSWAAVETHESAGSRQVFADITSTGTFVPSISLPAAEALEQKVRRAPWWEIALAGGVVLLVGFAIYFLNRPARP
jgi:hypothetical protein